MALKESEVGPADELTWGINWKKWLGVRTIQSSVWTVAVPVVKIDDTFTDTATSVKLKVAGDIGKTYEIVNKITTVDGEVEERRLSFTVVNR